MGSVLSNTPISVAVVARTGLSGLESKDQAVIVLARRTGAPAVTLVRGQELRDVGRIPEGCAAPCQPYGWSTSRPI